MKRLPRILTWLARGMSVPAVGIIILFMFGEGFSPSHFTLREGILFACFPGLVCTGMVISWFKERWGAMVSLAGLAAFYGLHYVFSHCFPGGGAFLVITAPAFLFLLASILKRTP
jgi:hypothetical protein